MTYTLASIPKSGANPGRPEGKDPNIIICRTSDISVMPERDEKGIKSVVGQHLTFNSGCYGIAIYATPSSIKRYDAPEGDADAKGYIQNLEFEHPGDEVAVEEFLENTINENLVALSFRSGFKKVKLHGTLEEPLQIEPEEQDDKDGLKKIFKLKSVMRGPKAMLYLGDKPALDTDSGSGGTGGV